MHKINVTNSWNNRQKNTKISKKNIDIPPSNFSVFDNVNLFDGSYELNSNFNNKYFADGAFSTFK